MLEATEQIERFKEYFETVEKQNLLAAVSSGKASATIDFSSLSVFDPKLALDLLEHPEETLKAAEQSIKEIELPSEQVNLKIRFYNLPSSIRIRDLRVKHLSTFVSIQGTIRQKSPVRPKAISTRYECPNCGNPIMIIQEGDTLKEPKSCSCGRQGKFRLLEKGQIDFQALVIEEALEDVPSGDKGDRIVALLKEDLTLPLEQNKYILGSKVTVNGILETVIKQSKSGINTQSEIALMVVSIEGSEVLFEDIKISKEEEEEFRRLSQDPNLMGLLKEALAPTIWGHNEIKQALILQLFGGIRKKLVDGSKRRGLVHLLIISDAGLAKSKLLERICQIHPKSRMVTMTSSTSKGITAAVVKDEFLGGWSLEAGPIVLANGGIAAIDEIGHMEKEDYAALHECMESETITIAKANIHEKLPASTSILAAGNPKLGRFDSYGNIAEQIGIPAPLMSRFDLVFAMKDIPNPKDDKETAEFIISVHQMGVVTSESDNPFYNLERFRHYVAYAIKTIKPKLTDEAANYIKETYINMRQKGKEQIGITGLTARNFEGLIRLSEAAAKTRLSPRVEVADAQFAIQLSEFCWRQMGYNPETGLVELDKIDTGITSSGRAKRFQLLELIPPDTLVEENEVIDIMETKGIPRLETEELIGKIKREGFIYEPRPGRLQRL